MADITIGVGGVTVGVGTGSSTTGTTGGGTGTTSGSAAAALAAPSVTTKGVRCSILGRCISCFHGPSEHAADGCHHLYADPAAKCPCRKHMRADDA